jgi:cytochrome c-type biogenesis protein CcmH
MRPAALLAALLLLLALAAPWASGASPSAELPDIEDEVMCTICGTLLQLSGSPQAHRERAFISRLIAQGKTKPQIKDALVAQYGPRVLAVPRASGFNLSAYLVPAIGFLAGAAIVAAAVLRWRRSGRGPGSPPAATGPRDEEAERLEEDLARYDL